MSSGSSWATITNVDNGKRLCLSLGEQVLVVLKAPGLSGPLWTNLRVAPAGVLRTMPLQVMLVRGATGRRLLAAHPGTATVSAERRACASSGTACTAILSFRVTVTVLGTHAPVPAPAPMGSPSSGSASGVGGS